MLTGALPPQAPTALPLTAPAVLPKIVAEKGILPDIALEKGEDEQYKKQNRQKNNWNYIT